MHIGQKTREPFPEANICGGQTRYCEAQVHKLVERLRDEGLTDDNILEGFMNALALAVSEGVRRH